MPIATSDGRTTQLGITFFLGVLVGFFNTERNIFILGGVSLLLPGKDVTAGLARHHRMSEPRSCVVRPVQDMRLLVIVPRQLRAKEQHR